MDMGRIFITGNAARTARRLARHGFAIALEPSDQRAIEPLPIKRPSIRTLGIGDLTEALSINHGSKIDLRVPSAADRSYSRDFNTHVCSVTLPVGSFERLVPTGDSSAIALPDGLEVFVDSPALTFVEEARSLTRLASSGSLSPHEASLRLFKLGTESCATYALNPWQPLEENCTYGLEPVTDAASIRAYVTSLHGVDGLGLARKVAPLLADRTASEMEAFLYAALALPTLLGGFALPRPSANKTIPLTKLQQMRLNHVSEITPDLLWEAWRVIIEYLGGKEHEGQKAVSEDAGRVQDFQTLGYQVFPTTFAHVKTPTAFNRLVQRITLALDQQGAEGLHEWAESLISDQEFLQRQMLLFKVLLPPVRDW